MKWILIFIFILVNSLIVAQNTWEYVYNPFPSADGYLREDIIKCSDGGFIFCGGVYWEEFMNPGDITSSYALTFKIDEYGILDWIAQDSIYYVPPYNNLALAEMSDEAIATAFISQADFISNIVKRDIQGNVIWQINSEFLIESLIDTDDGGIVAVGYSPNVENNIIKFSSEGDFVWGNRLNASNLLSVEKTSDGGFVTSGYRFGDVFVAKTDANGDTLWTRTLDGFNTTDEGKCVFETSDNEIIVVGRFDYAPGFIWKLDQNGEMIALEIVEQEICWQIISANEYIDNEIVTLSNSPDSIVRYNRFSSNLNFIDTMITVSGSAGDKGFLIDDGYLVYCQWPNLTVTKTLYQPVSISEDMLVTNNKLVLSNHPNPFNPSTSIVFYLQNDSNVELAIYNIKGQKINSLAHNNFKKGSHSVIWDGEDDNNKPVSSGVYIYKLIVDGKTEAMSKCLLLK